MELDDLVAKTTVDVPVGLGLAAGDEREKDLLSRVTFCPLKIYRQPAALLDALDRGEVLAAVRGSLPSSLFLADLRSRHPRMSTRRIALLSLADGKAFLLGPVGIDEGGTVRATRALVQAMRDFCSLIGWEPRVGVLSAGRPDDAGRSARIARSIRRGELAASEEGVRHFNIMIEEALVWANCVIAPDGVAGNLIYRTLAHLGNATSLGALYFPLGLRLADTSRSGALEEYTGAVALANIAAKGVKSCRGSGLESCRVRTARFKT
jgi:predicted methyltransferase MtxX (methanogen marker protein 4)